MSAGFTGGHRCEKASFWMTKKSTRVDFACKALRQAIIEQALPPGTRLPEDELGARFGMSRTLVRAALAHLHSEGLVDAPPRRTATTAKPTLEEAKEVFEVRRTLEREVVRLVIARWRPEFGAELEGHVREEEAARKAGEARVSIRLAGEFHIRLGEMAGNGLLRRYLGEVVSRCSLILALYGRPHSADCAVNEHREIVAALRGRNGGDGPSSRLRRASRAARPGSRWAIRSRRGAVALRRGRGYRQPRKGGAASQT
jgi:DNA-binding GntR family transcriptional regulator